MNQHAKQRETHTRRIVVSSVILVIAAIILGLGWWALLAGIGIGFVFAYVIVRPVPRDRISELHRLEFGEPPEESKPDDTPRFLA